jgi:hypothetical protein
MELGPQHPVTNHTTQLKACRELFLFYNLGFRCKVKQATPGTLSWHMLMLQVIICSLFFPNSSAYIFSKHKTVFIDI